MMFFTLILLLSKKGVGTPIFSFDSLNNFHGCHIVTNLKVVFAVTVFFFPQRPDRGGSQGANPGVLVVVLIKSLIQRP